jgi:hypothetical protein
MKACTRLLRLVHPDNGGARIKRVLEAMAVHYGAKPELVDQLVAQGRLKMYGDRRGATYGLPRAEAREALPAIGRPPSRRVAQPGARQRGFGLVHVLAGIALVGVVWGAVSWHASVHYARGQSDKQVEWDAANRKAVELAAARRLAVARALLVAENAKLKADEKARIADDNWKEAQRENRREGIALAVCPKRPAGPQSDRALAVGSPSGPGLRARAEDPGHAAVRGGLRFTWEFVRLFDSAWTGAGGEPVHAAAAGPEAAAGSGAAAPGGASAYTPDDVLDVHGENARRCSADRREYRTLILKIQNAARAWDEARRPH